MAIAPVVVAPMQAELTIRDGPGVPRGTAAVTAAAAPFVPLLLQPEIPPPQHYPPSFAGMSKAHTREQLGLLTIAMAADGE